MKRAILLLTLLVGGCGGAAPDATDPSALVTTVRPIQGRTINWITAYGAATPGSNGIETLSVPQPGQIERLIATPGSAVRAGQPILVFALAPSAQATYEAATSTLRTAREQRATTARLLTQQLATRDQLAQADKALADAEATVAAARREGGGQALQIIRAPFDGVVATIPVARGDRTQPGAALATVAHKGGIVVTIGIDPEERSAIRAGQPARLQSLDGGKSIDGHVLRVDSQLNSTTRLIDVDITIPAGALLNGQAMKVDIASGISQGWVVPHEAVVTDQDGAHVFQIVSGKAKAVPVVVRQGGTDKDIVSGAINSALPLIVSGAYQIEDGGAVRTGH